eukprot:TRINITY_DN1510_c0_g1_i1.p1 TRINITY_DN1510_c0_g1~~TRINITY_DN1510_c0_g1_i1.p1  ORF type:complete len:1230 (+),score=271.03 TRINITY_DN1510_c0_g1_i1:159-3692(+)
MGQIEDFVAELQQYPNVLKDQLCKTWSWDEQTRALGRLGDFLKQDINHKEYMSLYVSFQTALVVQLASDRSRVIGAACTTVSLMAAKLGPSFSPLAPSILSALFKKFIVTIKAIAVPSKQCASDIVESLGRSVMSSLPALMEGLNSEHHVCRAYCTTILLQIMKSSSAADLADHAAELQHVVAERIADSNGDVRVPARECYHIMNEHFPERAKSIYATLDTAQRRRLGTAAASSTSAPGGAKKRGGPSSLAQARRMAMLKKKKAAAAAANNQNEISIDVVVALPPPPPSSANAEQESTEPTSMDTTEEPALSAVSTLARAQRRFKRRSMRKSLAVEMMVGDDTPNESSNSESTKQQQEDISKPAGGLRSGVSRVVGGGNTDVKPPRSGPNRVTLPAESAEESVATTSSTGTRRLKKRKSMRIEIIDTEQTPDVIVASASDQQKNQEDDSSNSDNSHSETADESITTAANATTTTTLSTSTSMPIPSTTTTAAPAAININNTQPITTVVRPAAFTLLRHHGGGGAGRIQSRARAKSVSAIEEGSVHEPVSVAPFSSNSHSAVTANSGASAPSAVAPSSQAKLRLPSEQGTRSNCIAILKSIRQQLGCDGNANSKTDIGIDIHTMRRLLSVMQLCLTDNRPVVINTALSTLPRLVTMCVGNSTYTALALNGLLPLLSKLVAGSNSIIKAHQQDTAAKLANDVLDHILASYTPSELIPSLKRIVMGPNHDVAIKTACFGLVTRLVPRISSEQNPDEFKSFSKWFVLMTQPANKEVAAKASEVVVAMHAHHPEAFAQVASTFTNRSMQARLQAILASHKPAQIARRTSPPPPPPVDVASATPSVSTSIVPSSTDPASTTEDTPVKDSVLAESVEEDVADSVDSFVVPRSSVVDTTDDNMTMIIKDIEHEDEDATVESSHDCKSEEDVDDKEENDENSHAQRNSEQPKHGIHATPKRVGVMEKTTHQHRHLSAPHRVQRRVHPKVDHTKRSHGNIISSSSSRGGGAAPLHLSTPRVHCDRSCPVTLLHYLKDNVDLGQVSSSKVMSGAGAVTVDTIRGCRRIISNVVPGDMHQPEVDSEEKSAMISSFMDVLPELGSFLLLALNERCVEVRKGAVDTLVDLCVLLGRDAVQPLVKRGATVGQERLIEMYINRRMKSIAGNAISTSQTGKQYTAPRVPRTIRC